MRKPMILGLFAVPLFAIACASPATEGASSNEAADSTGASVPAFTAADQLDAWGARFRISADGAAFVEKTGMCSASMHANEPKRFGCSAGDVLGSRDQLFVDFGKAGAMSVAAGDTYATTTSDAAVTDVTWSKQGDDTVPASVARATTVSVTIDAVLDTPAAPSMAMRVIGHFTSSGSLTPLAGTFLADIPRPTVDPASGAQ